MRGSRIKALLFAFLLTIYPLRAYYHYIQYTNRSAPYNPITEKFDLNALPSKTVVFLVSDAGPAQFSPNDTFVSVLNQVRQATLAWNRVETSDLRVAFGGLHTADSKGTTPYGHVVFQDLAPGILGLGGPEAVADPVAGPNGTFVPITRSIVRLNVDMTRRPAPSYLEGFYTTVVHEMGHALGLQHTFTSAAMSTSVTRATSRAFPLDADDIAGISLLYPKPSFAAQTGSISGRVTSDGQGVHLASVVALPAVGSAVSSLTNPDGTYRIDGLTPGVSYWVYVHPLPPTANITSPLDPAGQPVDPSSPIETQFLAADHTGTKDISRSPTVSVAAGKVTAGVDFAVPHRDSVGIYDVTSFSYFGQNGVSPAYLSANGNLATIAVRGNGLTTNDSAPRPVSGLRVQIMGGFGAISARTYGEARTLALDLSIPPFVSTGPHPIVFSTSSDLYVLPAGIRVAQKQPPSISNVSPNSDGSVTIVGSNFSSDTRVFFDSQPAAIQTPFTGNDQTGTVIVIPPPGANGQHATITAFNPDGQNSMFVQPQSPPTYDYGPADAPQVIVSPAAVPAGATAMVDVSSPNMRFADGQVTIGLGSSDVIVNRVWVLSPSRVIGNVTVSGAAAAGAVLLNVLSGFQLAAQPLGFQVLPANSQLPNIYLPVLNATTGQESVYAGAVVSLFGQNLSVAPNSTVILLRDQPVQILYSSATQVNFLVPAGTPTGPAILKLNNGAVDGLPVVLQIDSPPPPSSGDSKRS